jgi:hypothetical protein
MSDVIGGLVHHSYRPNCLALWKTWGSRIRDFRALHYRNFPGERMCDIGKEARGGRLDSPGPFRVAAFAVSQ